MNIYVITIFYNGNKKKLTLKKGGVNSTILAPKRMILCRSSVSHTTGFFFEYRCSLRINFKGEKNWKPKIF